VRAGEGRNQKAFAACIRSNKPYKHRKTLPSHMVHFCRWLCIATLRVQANKTRKEPIMRSLSVACSNSLRRPKFYKNLFCISIVADVSSGSLTEGNEEDKCRPAVVLWRSFLTITAAWGLSQNVKEQFRSMKQL